MTGGAPGGWPANPGLYTGGAVGAVVIGISAWVVPRLGVLRFGLVSVAGQLTTGLLLDVLAAGAGQVRLLTVVAVVLTVLGVAVSRDRPR